MKKNYLRIIAFLLSLFVGIVGEWVYLLLSEMLRHVTIYNYMLTYFDLSEHIDYISLCVICFACMAAINNCSKFEL
jgi:hypothetical protein